MNVAIVGTGYVGLVTGTVLSEIGHNVSCLDINESKIEVLRSGKSPIYEPGLDEMLQQNIKSGRLTFTTKSEEAFQNSEVIFIAVGTPQGASGAADLTYLEQAAKNIAVNIKQDIVVVVKSTVPVGTNDHVEAIIRQHARSGIQVHVVSNPEFLREGHAIYDTMHGDRIVIGAEDDYAGNIVESLFSSIDIPVLRTDRKSAEMIKYASNAFLAVKISYINQVSNLCEALGADIHAVADGMGMDKRIGRAFLNAGLGYGGSCFPKDTEALTYLARSYNVSMSIVESAIEANLYQRELFLKKVLNYFNNDIQGKTIGILGLAFKPNTDDLREAPSLYLIEKLEQSGAIVKAYDPVVKHLPQCVNSVQAAITNSDAILLVTEWEEFFTLQLEGIQVFDGRNILKTEIY